MPATLGNSQYIKDNLTSYRSASSPKYTGGRSTPNMSLINKKFSTNVFENAIANSQLTLSQRHGTLPERTTKMSELPVEFKSNFAERNNYKILHQSNLSQVEKLTNFNTYHT